MSDGIHANYAKIGLAVVAGIVATVATLIYLGGAGDNDRRYFVETYYDNAISGLSVGSDVNFRGVKVGVVSQISFVCCEYGDVAEVDMQKIMVRMSLDATLLRQDKWDAPTAVVNYLVKKGLHATVTSSGITGLSKIELNFPKGEVVDAPLSWTPAYCYIPPAVSLIDNISDSAAKLCHQLNNMDLVSVWSNVSSVAESASRIADNLDALVESQRSGIADIVGNVNDVSASLKDLSSSLEENPSLLLRPRDPEPLAETER